MNIVKPIFIVGVERSGTTLLYSILANHPDLYWLSRLDSLLPKNPMLACLIRRTVRFLRPNDTYVARPGTISKSNGLIPPSECLPYWKPIFKWGNVENYLIEDDYFNENDLDEKTKENIHIDLKKRLHLMDRERVLFKQTGFTLKLRYINALFPDALILHVIRHPIAHLGALVRAKEREKTKFWGVKVPGWKRYIDADFTQQAIFQLLTAAEVIENDLPYLERSTQRYFRIKYEDLISSPLKTTKQVLSFCDLDLVPNIESAFEGIRPTNYFHSETQSLVDLKKILSPLFKEYDYDMNVQTSNNH